MTRILDQYKLAILVLLMGILGRAVFTGYVELIDPTEARYAVISEEMLVSKNWLTPKLPMPEGLIPYLGKPPLHFWLTTISYKFFGVDEWSTRIPSLLATFGSIFAIWKFASIFLPTVSLLNSSLIYFSSGMVFFLAGANITDVTLSFFVTSSIVFLFSYVNETKNSKTNLFLSIVFASLGFLTKGPVSLILIWFPIFLWSFLKKDFSWVKRFPWIKAFLGFLIITSPWFILCELYNPGFLKYFFWNENIARYLFKDYGDKYGSGHVYMYGTSWLMLVSGFMPWGFYLLADIWKYRYTNIKNINSNVLFLICWAVSAPIFFTFVRQQHWEYALPSMPALSMLTAFSLANKLRNSGTLKNYLIILLKPMVFLLIGIVIISIGMVLKFTFSALIVSLLLLSIGFLVLDYIKNKYSSLSFVSYKSFGILFLYLISLSSLAPYVNFCRSSKQALETIATKAPCYTGELLHRVGVSSRNSYSHYWIANPVNFELTKDVIISYVKPELAKQSEICHYIVKSKSIDEINEKIKNNFILVLNSGDWFVYSKPRIRDANI